MKRVNIGWLVFVLLVPLLSLWGLIFKPGLYGYADQHFPLSTTIPAYLIITSNPLGGFFFDRIIVTWPYFIFSSIANNIGFIERSFIYYTFALYSLLCYAFAYLSVDLFSRKIRKLSPLLENGGKLIIFILAYSNLSALNLNADGGTWSDGIILILISISIVLLLGEGNEIRIYLFISGLMLISFLLDPDYVPMFWIAVVAVSIVAGIIQKELRRIAYSVASVLISTLSILYLYLQAYWISPPSLPSLSAFNVLGYRSFSLSPLYTGNINYYNVLILFGHFWSTLVFSPPSILFYKNIFNLPALYFPAQVIVVPGITYYLWIAGLSFVPIISFSSLVFKNTRKLALPVLLVFFIAYIFTQEMNFKWIYFGLHHLVYLPVVGTAIGLSLSLPGHFINLIASSYLPLFSLGILSILSVSETPFWIGRKSHLKRKRETENRINIVASFNSAKRRTDQRQKESFISLSIALSLYRYPGKRNRRKDVKTLPNVRLHLKGRINGKRNIHTLRAAAVIVVIFLFISLAGWQAFNGSFYPMRAYPGSFLEGDAVPPKGVFSPTEVNPAVLGAYDLVTAGYNGYSTIWIGGPSVSDFEWAAPPDNIQTPSLEELISENLYEDVVPYLIAHSVRYVVISGDDISQFSGNPFTSYGFANYSSAEQFFLKSGLRLVYSVGNVYVLEVPNVAGPIYYSNMMLRYTGSSSNNAPLYSLFLQMGINLSLSENSGVSISVFNNSSQIDVVPPYMLGYSGVFSPENALTGESTSNFIESSFNSTDYKGFMEYYQNHSRGQFIHTLPGNFTTTCWLGNISFYYDNGSISATGKNSSFSVGFNGSLSGYPSGYYIGNSDIPVEVAVGFNASSSSNFTGRTVLNIIGEAKDPAVNTFFDSLNFSVSEKERMFRFVEFLPADTAYVGFRIGFYSFTGIVHIGFTNFTIDRKGTVFLNYSYPFGEGMYLRNTILQVPPGFRDAYFVYYNNSSKEIQVANISTGDSYKMINGSIEGIVLIKNASINSYYGHYAVINEGISRADDVKSDGFSLTKYYEGMDGSYIFPLNGNHSVSITVRSYIIISVALAYLSIIITSILLMSVYLMRKKGGGLPLRRNIIRLFDRF